jgi:hypothetical protein
MCAGHYRAAGDAFNGKLQVWRCLMPALLPCHRLQLPLPAMQMLA